MKFTLVWFVCEGGEARRVDKTTYNPYGVVGRIAVEEPCRDSGVPPAYCRDGVCTWARTEVYSGYRPEI